MCVTAGPPSEDGPLGAIDLGSLAGTTHEVLAEEQEQVRHAVGLEQEQQAMDEEEPVGDQMEVEERPLARLEEEVVDGKQQHSGESEAAMREGEAQQQVQGEEGHEAGAAALPMMAGAGDVMAY